DGYEIRFGIAPGESNGLSTDAAAYFEYLAAAREASTGMKQLEQHAGLVLQALALARFIAVDVRIGHAVPDRGTAKELTRVPASTNRRQPIRTMRRRSTTRGDAASHAPSSVPGDAAERAAGITCLRL